MGKGTSITCQDCLWTRHFYFGVGFSDCSLESYLEARESPLLPVVKDLIVKHGKGKEEVYDDAVATCRECAAIWETEFIYVMWEDAFHYSYPDQCPTCVSKQLEVLDESLFESMVKEQRLVCPLCKSHQLKISSRMLWD
ncbi:hypothetical protein [Halalkalibacillus halophilus]|uniref:hypothetical protein n=1 Tax=Halalkalibacillus halophilus TaxID=392827 RepID=UPI000419E03F|nr:hypothetical protein [Halalkalibacillus halophilus]